VTHMNMAIPPHEKERNASSAWIFRLALGALLIGVSVWGIKLCREFFRVWIGPDSLPSDSSFVNLGTLAAWALFFGPLAIAGVVMVWSTLRKMGALDQFAFWLRERGSQPDALLVNARGNGGIVPGSTANDAHGLESLSAETVERMQRTATRAATVLGCLVGALLLGIGVFGLIFLLFFPRTNPGGSIYVPVATGRLTISFAVFSGMLVFLGFTILQGTFRRDSNSWLLPLRVFTYMIVRRRQAVERAIHPGQHLPDTKQHPRV
jgi:hypothetical protein